MALLRNDIIVFHSLEWIVKCDVYAIVLSGTEKVKNAMIGTCVCIRDSVIKKY